MDQSNSLKRGLSIESKRANTKTTMRVIQLKNIEFSKYNAKPHSLSPAKRTEASSQCLVLPPAANDKIKTLILDLDETLVRSTLTIQTDYDETFKVNFF